MSQRQKSLILLLAVLVLGACSSGSGKFYDWCNKRDFPRVCQKYFEESFKFSPRYFFH